MSQSPYEFIPAMVGGQGQISLGKLTPSMVSDNDVAAKGLLPHDLLSGFDVHGRVFTGHGQNHHRVIAVVHGVNFVAFQVSDGGGSFLNHGDVDGIGDGPDVGDFLTGENAFKRQASLCRE